MGFYSAYIRPLLIASGFLAPILTGCVAFDPAVQSKVEDLSERPTVAILLFGFDSNSTRFPR